MITKSKTEVSPPKTYCNRLPTKISDLWQSFAPWKCSQTCMVVENVVRTTIKACKEWKFDPPAIQNPLTNLQQNLCRWSWRGYLPNSKIWWETRNSANDHVTSLGFKCQPKAIISYDLPVHKNWSLALAIPLIIHRCKIYKWVMWPWPRPFRGTL